MKYRSSLAWAPVALLFAGACGDASQGPLVTDDTADEATDEATLEVHLATCGGFGNLPCPADRICVDDPRDDCDPAHGGADCGGVCVKKRAPSCEGNFPKEYVSRDPAQCAAIRFLCVDGGVPFFDACGCGCEIVRPPCGDTTCGTGEYCCNPSCGICAPVGGFCPLILCAP